MILTEKEYFEGIQFMRISYKSWMDFYSRSSIFITVLEIVVSVKAT